MAKEKNKPTKLLPTSFRPVQALLALGLIYIPVAAIFWGTKYTLTLLMIFSSGLILMAGLVIVAGLRLLTKYMNEKQWQLGTLFSLFTTYGLFPLVMIRVLWGIVIEIAHGRQYYHYGIVGDLYKVICEIQENAPVGQFLEWSVLAVAVLLLLVFITGLWRQATK